MWGVGSIIFIYVLKPLLETLIKRIPLPVTVILTLLMLSDLIFTFVEKSKM